MNVLQQGHKFSTVTHKLITSHKLLTAFLPGWNRIMVHDLLQHQRIIDPRVCVRKTANVSCLYTKKQKNLIYQSLMFLLWIVESQIGKIKKLIYFCEQVSIFVNHYCEYLKKFKSQNQMYFIVYSGMQTLLWNANQQTDLVQVLSAMVLSSTYLHHFHSIFTSKTNSRLFKNKKIGEISMTLIMQNQCWLWKKK